MAAAAKYDSFSSLKAKLKLDEKSKWDTTDILRVAYWKTQRNWITRKENRRQLNELTEPLNALFNALDLTPKNEKELLLDFFDKPRPGLAIPTLSTLLAFRFPDRYAIYDEYVVAVLNAQEKAESKLATPAGKKDPQTIMAYISYCSALRQRLKAPESMRDLERPLFEYGRGLNEVTNALRNKAEPE